MGVVLAFDAGAPYNKIIHEQMFVCDSLSLLEKVTKKGQTKKHLSKAMVMTSQPTTP